MIYKAMYMARSQSLKTDFINVVVYRLFPIVRYEY